MSRRLSVAVCVLALAAAAPASRAQAQAPPPHTVYVLAPSDPAASSAHLELWTAIQVHLTAMPVVVRLMTVAETIDAELAQRIAGETGALSVVWLGDEGGSFELLTPSLAPTSRPRSLAGAGSAWMDRCQAMAMVVHAELAPLFEPPIPSGPTSVGEAPSGEDGADVTGDPGVEEPGVEEPGVEGEDAAPAPGDDEASGTAEAAGDVGGRERPTGLLLVTAGYTLFSTSSAAPPLHGLGLGLGIRIGAHMGVRAEVDVGQAAPLTGPAGEGRLTRWPLRVSLTGETAIGRLDVAGRAGLLIDLSRIRDLGFTPSDPDVLLTQLDLGFALGVELRIRLLPWLAPFVSGGVDLYADRRSYLLYGEEVARRDTAVPRLVLGVAWIAGKGGSR